MRSLRTLITLVLALPLMTGVFAPSAHAGKRQAADVQKPRVVVSSTHRQHEMADLVSARIRAGLHGEPYSVEQDCTSGDCVISIHR